MNQTSTSSQPTIQPTIQHTIQHTIQPPSKHALALMIWMAVFPTLTVLNLAIGGFVADLPMVLRTFVLATIAVPVVIYGLMPRLHRIRGRLILARAR